MDTILAAIAVVAVFAAWGYGWFTRDVEHGCVLALAAAACCFVVYLAVSMFFFNVAEVYESSGILGCLTSLLMWTALAAVAYFVYKARADYQARRAIPIAQRVQYLEQMDAMSGEEFERFCARVFTQAGYTVQSTPASHDGGVDLELRSGDRLVLVQCKRSARPVGVRAARELLGVVSKRGADKGILITNNVFTSHAEQFALTQRLELLDGGGLARLATTLAGTPVPAVDTFEMNQSRQVPARPQQCEAEPKVLGVGDYVRHRHFGEGVVLTLEGSRARIQFSAPHGVKLLDLTLAPLERLPD